MLTSCRLRPPTDKQERSKMKEEQIDNSKIYFKKASLEHQNIILSWLEEPHMKEFWDNSQEHRDDILNFIQGRKQYRFYDSTKYWVGFIDDQPFSFILSDQMLPSQETLSNLHRHYLSKRRSHHHDRLWDWRYRIPRKRPRRSYS